MTVNRKYLRSTILPRFQGRNIADITKQDVQRWFASLRATPAAADRSAPILSVIMRQAELYGYRPEGSNPCVGIRRYRRKGRERFLSKTELRRLARVLDSHEARHPGHVAFIRLLLLTGCRRDEVRTLQWFDYREGRLFLQDSKTGPRTVWLCAHARKILGELPRRDKWVFSSPRKQGPASSVTFHNFWHRIREEAGIVDARLHDCRHTYASIAIMAGESVTTTARLLGHNDAQTTLKYAHLSDRPVREAADTLAAILGEG